MKCIIEIHVQYTCVQLRNFVVRIPHVPRTNYTGICQNNLLKFPTKNARKRSINEKLKAQNIWPEKSSRKENEGLLSSIFKCQQICQEITHSELRILPGILLQTTEIRIPSLRNLRLWVLYQSSLYLSGSKIVLLRPNSFDFHRSQKLHLGPPCFFVRSNLKNSADFFSSFQLSLKHAQFMRLPL